MSNEANPIRTNAATSAFYPTIISIQFPLPIGKRVSATLTTPTSINSWHHRPPATAVTASTFGVVNRKMSRSFSISSSCTHVFLLFTAQLPMPSLINSTIRVLMSSHQQLKAPLLNKYNTPFSCTWP